MQGKRMPSNVVSRFKRASIGALDSHGALPCPTLRRGGARPKPGALGAAALC